LRAEAARTADAKQARRILAIAMVLDEHPRLLAAQAGGMDRQTLRDWVHRYNADGLAGLADRPRPGRQPRLAEAQLSEVAKWVEDGLIPRLTAWYAGAVPTCVTASPPNSIFIKAPAEDKVRAIAEIIGCDADDLLARAARVSSDLSDIIKQHPRELAALLRTTRASRSRLS
jgi:Winged helix-turn helix